MFRGFRFTSFLLNQVNSFKATPSIPLSLKHHHHIPEGHNSPTTFAIYIQENIKKDYITKTEFSRLSNQWELLSDEEKKHYATLQKLKSDEHLQLPEHQRHQKLQEHDDKRSQIILFKFFETTEYPCCPLSIFDVYRRSLESGKYSMDELKEHFEELSEDEMKVYMEKFNQEMHDYHHAVKKWKRSHGHKFNSLKKKLYSSDSM